MNKLCAKKLWKLKQRLAKRDKSIEELWLEFYKNNYADMEGISEA